MKGLSEGVRPQPQLCRHGEIRQTFCHGGSTEGDTKFLAISARGGPVTC